MNEQEKQKRRDDQKALKKYLRGTPVKREGNVFIDIQGQKYKGILNDKRTQFTLVKVGK